MSFEGRRAPEGTFEGGKESREGADRSLEIALALKRWAREIPGVNIKELNPPFPNASQEVANALKGDGIEITSREDLTASEHGRIEARKDSKGLDASLVIEKIGDDLYRLKIGE